MIEHVVMWRFTDGEGRTKEENCAYVKERLLALPAIIPEIKLCRSVGTYRERICRMI